MTGLLSAKQIACTADLQVAHCDFKAGAEFGKIPDGRQALFGDFSQVLIGLIGEVGVGVTGRTAHTAPELVELRKSKPVCVFDDQGVSVGDIQTGFNDGSADQYLDFAGGHRTHNVAEGIFAHLAVGHSNPKAGDPSNHGGSALVDGLHPVVQIIDLAAPGNLPADGIVNDGVAVLHDKCLDRVPVGRGSFQGGHIPDTGQGHVQCSGDGRSRQGQYIHTLGDLLQPFLVADTEALLFVDD